MRKIKIFSFIAMMVFMASSCEYEYYTPEPTVVIDPTVPVSFNGEIVPIFTSKCVSCHGGNQAPDLSEANAYSSISGGLLNTTTPAESKIYEYVEASSSSHSWQKYSANEANLLLVWIEQGAENN